MATISSESATSLQAILDARVASGDVPGVVYGVASRTEILFKGASGFQKIGQGQKMDTDSLFWIASCTKAVTSIACMQLVEQGKVKLDDAVDSILPELATPRILIDNETLETRPAVNKITLRMLVTHTSGLANSKFHYGINRWMRANFKDQDELSGVFGPYHQPLVAEPGTTYTYSIGLDWAGVLIERISGLRLGEYFKKYIFDPLGVDDITFDLDEAQKSRLVAMHQRSWDGTFSVRDHFPLAHRINEFHSGGAGAFASVESYLKILQVIINGGKGANGVRLLKEETLKEMLTDQVEYKLPGQISNPIDIVDATLCNEPFDRDPGTTSGWGISWLIINEEMPYGRGAATVKWSGLPNIFWFADKEKGVVGFFLTQILPCCDHPAWETYGSLERETYKALASTPIYA